MPVSGATTIGFLGSATNGPSTGHLTIHYTDGSSQTVTLGFSDWTLNANARAVLGNVEVADTPYRNSVGGTSQTVDTYLLSAGFPLTAGKTVESVTLPASADQGSLHVFAIGSDAGPLTSRPPLLASRVPPSAAGARWTRQEPGISPEPRVISSATTTRRGLRSSPWIRSKANSAASWPRR